jgi:subtilisin family serine protease
LIGVYVFILDTGVRWGHREFKNDPDAISRIVCGYDAFNFYHEPEDWNNGCYDGVGHGTHVAAIVGGSIYVSVQYVLFFSPHRTTISYTQATLYFLLEQGVAKDVAIVSVKVFTGDGRGSVGSVLAGLDYLLREKERNGDVAMIANLSFGTPVRLNILQTVIEGLVSAGVTVIASAGNDASDACDKFPGAISEVFTVAASTVNDEVAKFSNMGPCVNIFAPGDRITSAWRNSNFGRATVSGTSQSSAFAAGVAALVLELDPTMQPAELIAFLQDFAQTDALSDITDESQTLNLMLNMGGLELTT